MFPVRESSRHLAVALAALLITTELVFLSMIILKQTGIVVPQVWTHEPMAPASHQTGLKDNWELLIPQVNPGDIKSGKTVQSVQEKSESAEEKQAHAENLTEEVILSEKAEMIEEGHRIEEASPVQATANEKLNKLAEQYNADPYYLAYIVEVEKQFGLDPCELLAIIAQESGFKPQTHMDGGSLSYSTTQMKMPTAKTAHMAITEYYKIDIPYPTHELLNSDKKYAAFLAGGYLRYLHDTYQDKYESYTAYNWGIGGRMTFYNKNGHFKSPYALKIAGLTESFRQLIGSEYYILS
ncbi:MAG: transglycosylase SLT domain-containing protein [Desulfitobacteriia bacterium]|jgi:hypothetical protein